MTAERGLMEAGCHRQTFRLTLALYDELQYDTGHPKYGQSVRLLAKGLRDYWGFVLLNSSSLYVSSFPHWNINFLDYFMIDLENHST